MIGSLLAGLAQADCTGIDASELGAFYDVQINGAADASARHGEFELWRRGDSVIHIRRDNGIADYWTHTPVGLKLTRYFLAEKRGIEYQPGEVETHDGERAWSVYYQLVADALLHNMDKQGESGEGCDKLVDYSRENDGNTLTVQWREAISLPRYRLESRPDGTEVSWELTSVQTDPAQIEETFASLSSFDTTDYADIGDNESDPFLLKLISLGFVEHGASGFYDADGHALDGGHSH